MDYKAGKEIILRLDEDEEVVRSIISVCEKENVKSAIVSAIGAVKKIELAHFDTRKNEYHSRTFEGMYEVVSLNGNIAVMDNQIILHAHAVIADADFSTYGGHLNSATVNPTLEITIIPLENKIKREKDEKTGLNLQKF